MTKFSLVLWIIFSSNEIAQCISTEQTKWLEGEKISQRIFGFFESSVLWNYLG